MKHETMAELIAQGFAALALALLAAFHFVDLRSGVEPIASSYGLGSALGALICGYLTWRAVVMGFNRLVVAFSVIGLAAGVLSAAFLLASF